MAAAEAKHGLTSKLILCFLRHLDEEAAFATLAAAEPWLDRIAGVGLEFVGGRASARKVRARVRGGAGQGAQAGRACR